MTTGPPPTLYPKVQVTILPTKEQPQKSFYFVTIDPTIYWKGAKVHISVTKYIGLVPPGEVIIQIHPLEITQLPFRVVALSLNGGDVDEEEDGFLMTDVGYG
eukprot:4256929-Ditylum_brightwellii.AAC.1